MPNSTRQFIGLDIYVNGTLRTDLRKYCVGVTITEEFSNTIVSDKLSLRLVNFAPINFNFNDRIRVSVIWNHISNVYYSSDFYIDYVEENPKNDSHIYTVSGIEAALDLPFSENSNSFYDKRVSDVLDFAAQSLGITYTHSLSVDNYVGVYEDPSDAANSQVAVTFNGDKQIIEETAKLFGYFISLKNNELKLTHPVAPGQGVADTFLPMPHKGQLISVNNRTDIDSVKKYYQVGYIRQSDYSEQSYLLHTNLPFAGGTTFLLNEGRYRDQITAINRAYGEYYKDVYESVSYIFRFNNGTKFKPGRYFELDSTFQSYAGRYLILKVTHEIVYNQWITEVEAFPIDTIWNYNYSINAGIIERVNSIG